MTQVESKSTEQILWERLTAVFPMEAVRKGKMDPDDPNSFESYYYNYLDIVKRLNEVLGMNWSYSTRVVDSRQLNGSDELVLHCSLTIETEAGSSSREQFSTSMYEQGNSLANRMKAAASLGLTKCATLFGIGIELYDKEYLAQVDAQLKDKQEQDGLAAREAAAILATAQSNFKDALAQYKVASGSAKKIAKNILGISSVNWQSLTAEQLNKVTEFIASNGNS